MSIAGYVLAGGKNRRMNGEKKAFLTWKGEMFLNHVISAMESLEQIYLSVEAEEPYRQTAVPLVVDKYPETGPMGGIRSGLEICGEDALLVLPCDTPGITGKTVELLIRKYEETGKAVAAAAAGRIHPLAAVYTRDNLKEIERMMAEKNYRMMALLESIEYDKADILNADELMNINDNHQYMKLIERKWTQGK